MPLDLFRVGGISVLRSECSFFESCSLDHTSEEGISSSPSPVQQSICSGSKYPVLLGALLLRPAFLQFAFK